MTFSNAAESAAARPTPSSARPSAAARTRPTVSASYRGPSLKRATIASRAAACAACSAPVAPPPGAALRAARRVRKLPIVSSRMLTRLSGRMGTRQRLPRDHRSRPSAVTPSWGDRVFAGEPAYRVVSATCGQLFLCGGRAVPPCLLEVLGNLFRLAGEEREPGRAVFGGRAAEAADDRQVHA